MNVWLATWSGISIGIVIGVQIGWVYWHVRCCECRYKLGTRLVEESRSSHYQPKHYADDPAPGAFTPRTQPPIARRRVPDSERGRYR